MHAGLMDKLLNVLATPIIHAFIKASEVGEMTGEERIQAEAAKAQAAKTEEHFINFYGPVSGGTGSYRWLHGSFDKDLNVSLPVLPQQYRTSPTVI